MGYTHYWYQSKNFSAVEWADITADVRAIVNQAEERGIVLADWDGEVGSRPNFDAERIAFNGSGDESLETFSVTRKRDVRGTFCKTGRDPYDTAVTAVLCYLSSVVGGYEVSSDGSADDFVAGLDLAKAALPRLVNQLDVPRRVMEDDRWCSPFISHRTTRYQFRFCLDGHAYIIDSKKNRYYQFESHMEAAKWAAPYIKTLLQPSGYFDQRRDARIKAGQTRLFGKKLDVADMFERNIAPPALYRPGERPQIETYYWLTDILKKSAQAA